MITFDIPGENIHTEVDEGVIMLLEGKLSNIEVKVAPNIYPKYVIMSSKEKPTIYVQMQKALYGLIYSALLFYSNLVKDLKAYGFWVNLYDPCVEKRLIKNKKMAVICHMENLKVSHIDRF